MQLIYMLIGTMIAVCLLIQMFRGGKYDSWILNLPDDDYPIKELYVIGLQWNSGKLLSLKGKIKENDYIRTSATVL